MIGAFKEKLIVGLSIIAVLGIGAAVLLRGNIFFNPPLPRAANGIFLEQLLPQDAFLITHITPTDDAEKLRFKNILDAILQDKKDVIPQIIASEFSTREEVEGVAADVSNIFGDQPDILFAVSGTTSMLTRPDLYFLVALKDEALFNKYFDLTASNRSALRKGVVGNIAFITNASEEKAQALKDRANTAKNSLIKDKAFRKFLVGMRPPFSGYAYINAKSEKLSQVTGFMIKAEEKGLKFDSNIELKKTEEPNSTTAPQVSLYKKIAADSLIFFVESNNFADFIRTSFLNGEEFLKNFARDTGLDFIADIEPFLSGAYAVTVRASNLAPGSTAVLPEIDFYADVSAAPDKAKNAMKIFDEQIQQWVEVVNIGLEAEKNAPIAGYEKLKDAPAEGGIFTFKLSNLPDKYGFSTFKKMQQTVQLYYGITQDNVLFAAVADSYENIFGKGIAVSQHALYKQLEGMRKGEMNDMSIGDLAMLQLFFDRFISIMQAQKAVSPEELQAFDIAKKYLAPIKSFVQYSSGVGEKIKGSAFININ